MTNSIQRALAPVAVALLALAPATPGFAQERVHHLHDDGGARDHDFLRFELTSVKAGMFRSRVDGHVRDFDVSYAPDGDNAREVHVAFDVRDMATGNGGRDDKMWSYCLDAAHHSRIEVELQEPVEAGSSGVVAGRIRVRGRWRPIRRSGSPTSRTG